jgi:hypothetical protein
VARPPTTDHAGSPAILQGISCRDLDNPPCRPGRPASTSATSTGWIRNTPCNESLTLMRRDKHCATPPGSPPGTNPLAPSGTDMRRAVGSERLWMPLSWRFPGRGGRVPDSSPPRGTSHEGGTTVRVRSGRGHRSPKRQRGRPHCASEFANFFAWQSGIDRRKRFPVWALRQIRREFATVPRAGGCPWSSLVVCSAGPAGERKECLEFTRLSLNLVLKAALDRRTPMRCANGSGSARLRADGDSRSEAGAAEGGVSARSRLGESPWLLRSIKPQQVGGVADRLAARAFGRRLFGSTAAGAALAMHDENGARGESPPSDRDAISTSDGVQPARVRRTQAARCSPIACG